MHKASPISKVNGHGALRDAYAPRSVCYTQCENKKLENFFYNVLKVMNWMHKIKKHACLHVCHFENKLPYFFLKIQYNDTMLHGITMSFCMCGIMKHYYCEVFGLQKIYLSICMSRMILVDSVSIIIFERFLCSWVHNISHCYFETEQ